MPRAAMFLRTDLFVDDQALYLLKGAPLFPKVFRSGRIGVDAVQNSKLLRGIFLSGEHCQPRRAKGWAHFAMFGKIERYVKGVGYNLAPLERTGTSADNTQPFRPYSRFRHRFDPVGKCEGDPFEDSAGDACPVRVVADIMERAFQRGIVEGGSFAGKIGEE